MLQQWALLQLQTCIILPMKGLWSVWYVLSVRFWKEEGNVMWVVVHINVLIEGLTERPKKWYLGMSSPLVSGDRKARSKVRYSLQSHGTY